MVNAQGGYEYIGGAGTITQPDGSRVSLTNGGAPEPAAANTGPTEEANWAVDFDYVFPDSFWSVGAHQYVLRSVCPSFPDLTATYTFSFQVSGNATLYPDPVYFRLTGLREYTTGNYNTLDTINPGQATTAEYTLQDATRSEIDQDIAECKITISWDGEAPQMLVAQTPYQQ